LTYIIWVFNFVRADVMEKDKVITSFRIPAGLHRRMKLEAAASNIFIGELIERAFDEVYGTGKITDTQRLDWLSSAGTTAPMLIMGTGRGKHMSLREAIDTAINSTAGDTID